MAWIETLIISIPIQGRNEALVQNAISRIGLYENSTSFFHWEFQWVIMVIAYLALDNTNKIIIIIFEVILHRKILLHSIDLYDY